MIPEEATRSPVCRPTLVEIVLLEPDIFARQLQLLCAYRPKRRKSPMNLAGVSRLEISAEVIGNIRRANGTKHEQFGPHTPNMLTLLLSGGGILLLAGVGAIVRSARLAPDGVEDDLGFRVAPESALEIVEATPSRLNCDCGNQSEIASTGLEEHAFPFVGDPV